MHGVAIIENPGRVRLIRRRLGAMPAGEVSDNGDPNAGGERERYSHGFHFLASLVLLARRLLFVTFMNHKDKTTKNDRVAAATAGAFAKSSVRN